MKNRTHTVQKAPPEKFLATILEFIRLEAASGILLLAAAVVALVWANSPWAGLYFDLWQTKFGLQLGSFSLSKPLLYWINDGLMALFFFVIGLEIKREVLVGELSTFKKAALPIVAAVGGMLVPAAIYTLFNAGSPGAAGWGTPMATDIAFALGILALLGKRVPEALKVFLIALAIVDDIGAVLVIALFYTAQISWLALAVGAIFLVALIVLNWAHVRHPLAYALLGLGLWLAFLQSGVHTTVAGVLVAMTIPARSRIDPKQFLDNSRAILDRFEAANGSGSNVLANEAQQAAMQDLEIATERVEPPLQRLERRLHPWAIFVIMPLFALANAGVALSGGLSAVLTHPVSLGILSGLIFGKSLGILFSTWLAVRSNLATLPAQITWRQIYGMGWIAGIGFTMSLFIANLAFGETLLEVAKVGILAASLIAGTGGWLLLGGTGPILRRVSQSLRLENEGLSGP